MSSPPMYSLFLPGQKTSSPTPSSSQPSLAEPEPQKSDYSLIQLPPNILKKVEERLNARSTSERGNNGWDGLEGDRETDALFEIKGTPSDDAVLCTLTETWAVKGVGNSNTMLIVQGSGSVSSKSSVNGTGSGGGKKRKRRDDDDEFSMMEEEDLNHENDVALTSNDVEKRVQILGRPSGGGTLEIVKDGKEISRVISKIDEIMKGRVYDGEGVGELEEMEMEFDDGDDRDVDGDREEDVKVGEKKQLKIDFLREIVQCSDVELDRILKRRRIVEIKGTLRPLSPYYLSHRLLPSILSSLRFHELTPPNSSSTSSSSLPFSLSDLQSGIAATTKSIDNEIEPRVVRNVLGIFASRKGGKGDGEDGIDEDMDGDGDGDEDEKWKLDDEVVVREIGLGILEKMAKDPIPQETFFTAWKSQVGEEWSDNCKIELLAGNYIPLPSTTTPPKFRSLPLRLLPTTPQNRLKALFAPSSSFSMPAGQNIWPVDDLLPFLVDLAELQIPSLPVETGDEEGDVQRRSREKENEEKVRKLAEGWIAKWGRKTVRDGRVWVTGKGLGGSSTS